jgi:2-keto-4-pentenoate hydratase/2-oxohepta-3-ene-1,7-dioic acid hydratase in catechol pathway
MRLVQFFAGGEVCPGVLLGSDHLVNLRTASLAYPDRIHTPIDSMISLLQQGDTVMGQVRALIADLSSGIAGPAHGGVENIVQLVRGIKFAAPVLSPQKIIGVGLNYRDHCEENHLKPPKFPITFSKFPSAIIGPEEAIDLHADVTQQVDYEAEFAVVIGKRACRVSEREALEYVAGYTAVNDVSARDLQFAEGQWVRAKSLDTFCPLGPALVTRDEIPDPHTLDISCAVNGEIVQHSNTRNLLFGVQRLVSHLSSSITLLPGDIISTGTPGGVGYYRKPPLFLKRGDRVEVEIERIGILSNPVL